MTNIRNMALDDSGKYGYVTDVTDGTAGFVRVFDRITLKLVTSIPTGASPPPSSSIPPQSRSSPSTHTATAVTVIDSATNQVIATISFAGRPGSAVADGNGSIFVRTPCTRRDHSHRRRRKEGHNLLATCSLHWPNGLAIDSARHQLFTTCEDHKLVAVNADTGHVITIGDAPPSSGDIDFDPKHNMLFLANDNGMLTVFRRQSPNRYTVVQQIKTQPGARTMTVNHDDDKAYLVTAKFAMNTAMTSEELKFRPTPVPGTFSVIVIGR